jgi:hypothetical protein
MEPTFDFAAFLTALFNLLLAPLVALLSLLGLGGAP